MYVQNRDDKVAHRCVTRFFLTYSLAALAFPPRGVYAHKSLVAGRCLRSKKGGGVNLKKKERGGRPEVVCSRSLTECGGIYQAGPREISFVGCIGFPP